MVILARSHNQLLLTFGRAPENGGMAPLIPVRSFAGTEFIAYLHAQASEAVIPLFQFAIIFGLWARLGTLTLYTYKTVARFAQGLAARYR
jgi:hypothetical protein